MYQFLKHNKKKYYIVDVTPIIFIMTLFCKYFVIKLEAGLVFLIYLLCY